MEMDSSSMLWGLPIAFTGDESAVDRISAMSDEEREFLREKSRQVKSEKEMEELVKMVAEGRFE